MVIDARAEQRRMIARARAGDGGAWQALLETELEPAFRLAYLALGDAAEAQDAVQEALISAWRNLGRFDSTRPFRPWWLRIVLNSARNRRRSLGRRAAALRRAGSGEPGPSPEDRAAHSQMAGALWQTMKSLERGQREVVVLRYYLEMPVAECAQVLGVAPGTVKSRLSRALAKLEKQISREYPELAKEWADGRN
jgi:RNA polymerase sigma-70 factor (ECF subfamily)